MYKIVGADGKEYGPISADQVRQWIAEGRANAQTEILLEGTTEWRKVGELPEFAVSPSAPPLSPSGVPAEKVPNYLVQAILCTLCCCLPLGIVAIVYAAQVNTKFSAGDYTGAQEASKKAKMWCWISFGLGIVAGTIWIAVQVFVVAGSRGAR